jgi:hypothetical protein
MTVNHTEVISLTPEQVHAAAARASTYESFGRAIVSNVLLQTAEQNGMVSAAASTIPLAASVRSATFENRDPAIARSVCIDVSIGGVSIHVFIE